MIPDPELPGHILLEQYQAQLVSAVRTALDQSSGPILLEAGLQLASKILTSGVISQDQVAVKRIFSLISHPLDDFNNLYYPSFAEWVSCKIKVRLLTAHASLKCYTYTFLKRQHDSIPEEYQALLPLFSRISLILGTYWLSILKDYSYICFHSQPKTWKPFLDGIQSSLVSRKLLPCLEDAWPLILQALTLDAFPMNFDINGSLKTERGSSTFTSGYGMVELKAEDYRFLYGFSLLALFQGQDATPEPALLSLGSVKSRLGSTDLPMGDSNFLSLKPCGIVLPVFQSLCAERFFSMGFVSMDICRELLQVISYIIFAEDSWDSLAVYVLFQIVQNCPKDFLEIENFRVLASELCFAFLFKFHLRKDVISLYQSNWDDISSISLNTATTLLQRCKPKMQLKSLLGFLLVGYKCVGGASTQLALTRACAFVQTISSMLRGFIDDNSVREDDGTFHLATIFCASLNAITSLTELCTNNIRELESKNSNLCKLLQMKLAFSLEQSYSFAKLQFDVENPTENEERNSLLFSVLHHSFQCTRAVLTDDDTQVQAVGLQALKGILQKGIGRDCKLFLTFFVGELIGDISFIMQKFLQKPINREAVAITVECFKILMLLQTLPKDSECQKGLISLILEVVVMVFSTSEDRNSQESNDIRSTAVKFVSQLAQIPSTASYFKDVLVTMPVTRRQQLQEIIRASVTQDQSSPQVKSAVLPLAIKLPAAQTEKSREKDSPPSAPTADSSQDSEEEEDDDWDNFQSFPASTNDSGPTSEMSGNLAESAAISFVNSAGNDDEEPSSSLPPSNIQEYTTVDQKSCDGGITDEAANSNEIKEPQDFNSEVLDEHHQERSPVVAIHNPDQIEEVSEFNTEELPDEHHQERSNVVVSDNQDQNSPEVQFSGEQSETREKSEEIVVSKSGEESSQSLPAVEHVESFTDLSVDHHDRVSSEVHEEHIESGGRVESFNNHRMPKDNENPENNKKEALSDSPSVKDAKA